MRDVSVSASVRRVIILQVVRNPYPKRRIRPWLARDTRFGCSRICRPLRSVSTVTFSHRRFANAPRQVASSPSVTFQLPTQCSGRAFKLLSNLPKLAPHRQLRLKHRSFFETQLFVDLSNTIFPPKFFHLVDVPFVISTSNVDFIQQRLD